MDAGFPLSFKGKLEAGLTWGINKAEYFQTNTATQQDVADKTKFTFYSPYTEIEFNTLNHKQYSNEGTRIFALVQFVSGSEKHTPGSTSLLKGDYSDYHNYFIFKFMYDRYFRVGSIYRPGISFEVQANTLNSFRNYTSTTLYMPGYAPVYEMSTIYQPVYRPAGYSALGIRNVFSMSKNIDLRIEGFLMAPFREMSRDDLYRTSLSVLFPSVHYILSTSFVFNTPIGPLSASLNKYDDGSPVSFFVNVGFIIFNRSAF